MKPALLRYLACPSCGSTFECTPLEQVPVSLTTGERQIIEARGADLQGYEVEILTGRLACGKCQVVFPIRDGVPRLYKDADRDWPLPVAGLTTTALGKFEDDKHVQASFSRQWDEFDYQEETIWHWTLEERIATFCEEVGVASPEEFRGKLMVDAGCGPAILSMNLSQRYGIEIIAMDLSFVLSRAFRQNQSNICHFIQCSVLAPPLRPDIADLTYSHGVLHHTESTNKAFDAVERLTRPGGLLYVWLYGRKEGWNRLRYVVIRAIRGVNSRLPKFLQTVVIYLLTAVHLVIRTLKKLVGMRVAPIDSLSQLLVITRDHYTPKHAREHTEAEVKGWFREKGYTGIERRTEWKTFADWNGSTDLAIRGTRSQ